ncbi:MAG: TolC family protein [Bacteroidota bacterium]|nr:TolC family protein [Bacteroidota bacterium]
MKKKVFLHLLVLLPFACFAQQRLTLSDAVSTALKNNLGIQLAKNNVAIATVNNDYGIAGGLPFVAFNASDNEQTSNLNQTLNGGVKIQRNGNINNAASVGLTANVLVYNGGRIVAEKKRLENVQTISEYQLSSKGLILASNVILKYYDIVRQQSYAKTLEKSIEVSRQKLSIIQTQKEIGLANNADLFQAQLDLNAQLQTLSAQQLVIDQGKTDLLTLLTLKGDSAITINDTILVNKHIRLDSILNNLQMNPDISVAEKQIQVNALLERETLAQRYPSVLAATGYNYNRTQNSAGNIIFNQNYGPYIGLSLSLPIYNGSIFKKQSQIAGMNTSNSKLLRDTLVLAYNALAIKSWQAYKSNLEQLETQQKNYELSLQLLDLVMQRFQLRQATIIDVKLAQQSYENAAYQLVNLSYAAKSAEVQLQRLINRLRF